MNYRSVVILGQARIVVERQEKLDALTALPRTTFPAESSFPPAATSCPVLLYS
jgi:nitroimidazol reductase NimA-like FMN-containing flavoprotein (pyridoxamine 5'-phosphate oxidase superfamily)